MNYNIAYRLYHIQYIDLIIYISLFDVLVKCDKFDFIIMEYLVQSVVY